MTLSADMSNGPVCAMVWEGTHAVRIGRAIIGATFPVDAEPMSVRGIYARACLQGFWNPSRILTSEQDISRNVCHGSDTVESADREVRLWFEDGEIAKATLI